jgi:hypothetical protein
MTLVRTASDGIDSLGKEAAYIANTPQQSILSKLIELCLA